MATYKGAASEAGRAANLIKKRELQVEEVKYKKKKIEEEMKVANIENKFATHYDAVEQQLKSSTIGLVTLDEMKAKQEIVVKEREKKLALKNEEKMREKNKAIEEKELQKSKQKRQIQTLSFADEDEDDDEEDDTLEIKVKVENKNKAAAEGSSSYCWEKVVPEKVIPKLKKDPTVDTSFLFDREREEQDNILREQLRQEWITKQNAIKSEGISITYSYWDGSGHRKSLTMKKGDSIYQFLQKCLETLRPEFSELKSVTADQLMYVKEDLILPQSYTFYDFIVTKARGKSGPLFQFDAYDDIRLVCDASVEKEESHAGKVLLRSWYERNKHIFPASRWEPFDPTKNYGCKYTIK